MADPTNVQTLTGVSSAATTTPAFSAAGAGNLLCLLVQSQAYRLTTGSNRPEANGWTLAPGFQQFNNGYYLWYKIAVGGETSVPYSLTSAAPSSWILLERNNIAAFNVQGGQQNTTGPASYTTPALNAGTGRRWALGGFAALLSGGMSAIGGWTNSYAEAAEVAMTGGENVQAVAELTYDAAGGTTSTGASWTACEQVGAIGAVFDVSSGVAHDRSATDSAGMTDDAAIINDRPVVWSHEVKAG